MPLRLGTRNLRHYADVLAGSRSIPCCRSRLFSRVRLFAISEKCVQVRVKDLS
jgi:hypothetical protein